jgi:hypothetical protein
MPPMPKKKFYGDAKAENAMDALHGALQKAYEDAKQHNKHTKKLRVESWHVSGENPLNWSGIVLVDDDDND